MTKSKYLASPIVVPSIFVIYLVHLVNYVQFLNAPCIVGAAVTVISPFTKM